MLICDNGVIREATEAEIEMFNNTPEPGTEELTAEEIVAAIEEAMA